MGGYDEIEGYMEARANPYPVWTYGRGKEAVSVNPYSQQSAEVQPHIHLGPGTKRGTIDVDHQIKTVTADPGRYLGHPSRIVAPLLISSNQPRTFDRAVPIIAWAPNPIVQRSYGQLTLAPDDMRHTIPKELLTYSTNALSQQELIDEATLRVRRSMYGR